MMMKKMFFGLLLATGLLAQTACTKSDVTTAATPLPAEPLTTKVYDWLERTEQTISRQQGKEQFRQLRRHLHLDQAWQERLDSSLGLLLIPLDADFTPTRNATEHPLHYLLLKIKSDGSIRDGHLVQYIPAGTDRDRVPEGTFTRYFNSGAMPDSRVVFMTPTGNYLYETLFTGGRMHTFKVLNDPQAQSPTEEECIDWYLQTWVDGVLVSEVYVFTTCGPYVEEGTGGGSSGGGELEPERTKDLIWEVAHNPVPGVNGSIMSMEVVKGKKVQGYPEGGYFTRMYHHGSSCNFCHTDHPFDVWIESSHQTGAWGQQASAYVIGDLQFEGAPFPDLNNTKTWRFEEVFP